MASLILATMSVKSLEYIFVDIFFFSNLLFSPGVHGATEGVPGNGRLVRREVGHKAFRAGRHGPVQGFSHLASRALRRLSTSTLTSSPTS